MRKRIVIILLLGLKLATAQTIQNSSNLDSFIHKINENKTVTQILLLGDSHIQFGVIPNFLKNKFQEKYGNAGRGFVFPYQVANSNQPNDYQSFSNKQWQTFRLVYEQNMFSQMGLSGFVMGNNEPSFLEIKLNNPKDTFSTVKIFSDKKIDENTLTFYTQKKSLSDFITKQKERVNYTVQNETFPELATKFNTVTTYLIELNGKKITIPHRGMKIKADKVEIDYNSDFEKEIKVEGNTKIKSGKAVFNFSQPQTSLLIKTNSNENIFYGFQLLNSAKKGVVFNTVGVNGATYKDFLKYPLQMQQIQSVPKDLVIISLGTNESLSNITEQEFKSNISTVIYQLRKDNSSLPILLISPTTNNLSAEKIPTFVKWIKESAKANNTAFLNMYQATGKDYFVKSLKDGKANKDGAHFLPKGYEEQAKIIWNSLLEILDKKTVSKTANK